MAAEVRSFQVTVPAGTAAASPQVTSLTMPSRIVRGVRVRIPPGPAGSVGWALGVSGQPILPWNAGAWIVADDEVIDWPLEGQPTTGAWELRAYNTGRWDHTLYLTFQLDPLSRLGPATLTAPLDLSP